MKQLCSAISVLFLLGCSQDGSITVHNQSGSSLELYMDGSSYHLYDGEVVTKPVEIGRKFIFGPDDRAVAVAGEGECKWPFEDVVVVVDNRSTVLDVYGDAGYFDICNVSGHALELYLSPCSSDDWGEPLELIRDGYCSTWMVEEGCWDMMTISIEGQFKDTRVFVAPCDVVVYDIEPVQLAQRGGGGAAIKSPIGGMFDEDASKGLRKKKTGTRVGR